MVVQQALPRRSNPKIQSRKFTRIHWGSYLYGFVDWRLCRNKFAVLYIQSCKQHIGIVAELLPLQCTSKRA